MTDRPRPPTEDERLAFDAATRGSPREFVRICRRAGKEPGRMLDRFDATPWRWLYYFSPSDLVSDGMRTLPYPPEIRARLDATRKYVEAPKWQRMFCVSRRAAGCRYGHAPARPGGRCRRRPGTRLAMPARARQQRVCAMRHLVTVALHPRRLEVQPMTDTEQTLLLWPYPHAPWLW